MYVDDARVAPRNGLRITTAILVLTLMVGAVACSKKASETELANQALAAGLAAHKAGRLAEAAADYREVLVHDPNNKFAYYNLGVIDQTNGAFASADSNYNLALSIDPNYVPALFNLAIVKTAEGDLSSAIQLYQGAIQAQPDYAEAHLNLGFALIDDGQKKDGKAELAKAVKLDPSLASRIPPAPSPSVEPSPASGKNSGSETPTPSPS
jgi:tetratricopeptide (TPR) repeat protein